MTQRSNTPMTPKPKRRWFQYSLRTLFVAIAVLGVWLAMVTSAARRQQSIVARLSKLNANVAYEFQFDAKGDWDFDAVPPGPKWLREMVGQDYFSDVVYVDCGNGNLGDAGSQLLRGLKRLRKLHISNAPLTDAGLQPLRELKELKTLDLIGAHITDAGLECLEGLGQLHELSLQGTGVTDAGLEHLSGLSQLRELDLSEDSITDVGLEHLKVLKQLQVLRLYGTKITDAGLEHLKGLPSLRYVNLNSCTRVTLKGIQSLQKSLPNLQFAPPPPW